MSGESEKIKIKFKEDVSDCFYSEVMDYLHILSKFGYDFIYI
jgi:hypothetical protein